MLRQCEYCGVTLTRKGQKRFCSISCAAFHRGSRQEYRNQISERQTERYKDNAEREAVSIRQKERYKNPANRPWYQPMGSAPHSLERRNMASRAIKKSQAWTLGGNGRPSSHRQEKLAQALGWHNEYVVVTHQIPHAYKIDVAEPNLKIAIEVGNHASLRKQEWYRKNGWTYLHFSNRMVENWMEGVLQMVSSTILKLQTTTTMSPMES